MSDRLQITLLIATAIAGLSGWAAIFAWWFRERSKTVRGIKELRRTNTRLQKTLMFTLDKWRDQVERNLDLLSLEDLYASTISSDTGDSIEATKARIRSRFQRDRGYGDSTDDDGEDPVKETIRQLTAIRNVEQYAKDGTGTMASLEVEAQNRRAA